MALRINFRNAMNETLIQEAKQRVRNREKFLKNYDTGLYYRTKPREISYGSHTKMLGSTISNPYPTGGGVHVNIKGTGRVNNDIYKNAIQNRIQNLRELELEKETGSFITPPSKITPREETVSDLKLIDDYIQVFELSIETGEYETSTSKLTRLLFQEISKSVSVLMEKQEKLKDFKKRILSVVYFQYDARTSFNLETFKTAVITKIFHCYLVLNRIKTNIEKNNSLEGTEIDIREFIKLVSKYKVFKGKKYDKEFEGVMTANKSQIINYDQYKFSKRDRQVKEEVDRKDITSASKKESKNISSDPITLFISKAQYIAKYATDIQTKDINEIQQLFKQIQKISDYDENETKITLLGDLKLKNHTSPNAVNLKEVYMPLMKKIKSFIASIPKGKDEVEDKFEDLMDHFNEKYLPNVKNTNTVRETFNSFKIKNFELVDEKLNNIIMKFFPKKDDGDDSDYDFFYDDLDDDSDDDSDDGADVKQQPLTP